MICVDIWGGLIINEHLARYILPMSEALQLAENEINSGFLVNLRTTTTWGLSENFDNRFGDG